MSPDKGLDVALSDSALEDWMIARHDRDLLSSHNPAKPKPGKDGKPEPVKSFVDKVMDKALSHLRGEIKDKGGK